MDAGRAVRAQHKRAGQLELTVIAVAPTNPYRTDCNPLCTDTDPHWTDPDPSLDLP
jgi:hypothetical protein